MLSFLQILANIMTVATLAFFSRISDSRFGGTYMTLLNTLSNLGGAWSSSVAIGMIDYLTFKECSLDRNNNCSTSSLKNVRNSNKSISARNDNNFHYYIFVYDNIIKNVLFNLSKTR